MSSIYEHPSLHMSVTPDQRDRAESWLKDAYADGRVSESEFDERMAALKEQGQTGPALGGADVNIQDGLASASEESHQ